jgi:outer membrane protein OmpA-like peptidoglycan-associated protein
LNERGRALLKGQPHGLRVTLEVRARAFGSTKVLRDSERVTILARRVRLVPAFGMFDPLSADLDATTRRYLVGLKPMLATAKTVRCHGYTSESRTRSRAALRRLGLLRARAVCSYLRAIGVKARISTRTFGPLRPLAPRTSWRATRSNQRVELTITR